MEKLKIVGYGILGLGIIFAIITFLNTIGLIQYSFFAPKYENARRQVFENTQSYVEGKRQELVKLKYEYDMAKDSSDKEIIKTTIRHSFANVDKTKFDYELQLFLDKCYK